jgi:hypothetical protein
MTHDFLIKKYARRSLHLSGYLTGKNSLWNMVLLTDFRETPVNIEKCSLVNSPICYCHLKVSLASIEKRLTG